MQKYTPALLLIACIAATIECKKPDPITEELFTQETPSILPKRKTELKKEKKKRTDRDAFAMNATGAIIGALLYRNTHRFPAGGVFRRNNILLTQSRIETASTVATASGFVSALLYKIWKTDEKIVRITARQVLNTLGVSLVSNIGLSFIC